MAPAPARRRLEEVRRAEQEEEDPFYPATTHAGKACFDLTRLFAWTAIAFFFCFWMYFNYWLWGILNGVILANGWAPDKAFIGAVFLTFLVYTLGPTLAFTLCWPCLAYLERVDTENAFIIYYFQRARGSWSPEPVAPAMATRVAPAVASRGVQTSLEVSPPSYSECVGDPPDYTPTGDVLSGEV